jgi:DNA-binding FadR family transcriptional regulator
VVERGTSDTTGSGEETQRIPEGCKQASLAARQGVAGIPSGCGRLASFIRWCRYAQPSANRWEPFGFNISHLIHHSITPSLHHSITPSLHHSITPSPMNITALERPASLVESVCQQLAELIRGGSAEEERWLPGERSLAEKLGVSRTVVREATKRLEQQGMLEIQHGTGIKIVDRLHRPLNDSLSLLIPDMADRLQQLNETRLSIEPDAAAYAAQRATKEQIKTMRRVQKQLENAAEGPAAIEADIAAHHAIADASGNLIYRLILDSLADLGVSSRLRTIGRIGKAAAVEQHEAILVAIENRDPEAARAVMRTHILAAGEDMDLAALKTRKEK